MATKRVWIGTSWKMNKTLAEALDFASALRTSAGQFDRKIQSFVIPSFTSVREVKKALSGMPVLVGAQNMHWEDDGAWTGEISPLMLKDCNVDIVELGHSERRTHFGDTNSTVAKKAQAAVRHGIVPLICVGETLQDRDAGRATGILQAQVSSALDAIKSENAGAEVLLAYEPVWAIGDGGTPASPDYADQRHAEIIASAENILGRRIPCLYGGSVNPGNCAELIQCEHVDGLFIGRSAWDAGGYLDILARCSKVI